VPDAFYRQSFTDWHYHATDETIMRQMVGAKQVRLLPPDQPTCDAMSGMSCAAMRTAALLPDPLHVRQLRSCRDTVEEGDGLYIPDFWWHAVESIDARWNVTVAATFVRRLCGRGWSFRRRVKEGNESNAIQFGFKSRLLTDYF
jgi:hypothetical protein